MRYLAETERYFFVPEAGPRSPASCTRRSSRPRRCRELPQARPAAHRCFYHYVLGKLGASLAAIDPKKQGRCMCEIFGNYGWEEGLRLGKDLTDHFLVQGGNHPGIMHSPVQSPSAL